MKPLRQSALATALVWLAIFTALFMCTGVLLIVIKNRKPIIFSGMLVNERDLLRNMVNYKKPCPYHYFFSLLQISSWIVFRITKMISEKATYPMRKSPFSRFLSYYFDNPKKDSSEDRLDGAKLRTIATEQVYEQYQRWAVMRFIGNEISNDEMNLGFDEFGARRYD